MNRTSPTAILLCLSTSFAEAQEGQTLITNVHVFDGVNEARIENANVLIEGKLIAEVSTGSIDAPGAASPAQGRHRRANENRAQ